MQEKNITNIIQTPFLQTNMALLMAQQCSVCFFSMEKLSLSRVHHGSNEVHDNKMVLIVSWNVKYHRYWPPLKEQNWDLVLWPFLFGDFCWPVSTKVVSSHLCFNMFLKKKVLHKRHRLRLATDRKPKSCCEQKKSMVNCACLRLRWGAESEKNNDSVWLFFRAKVNTEKYQNELETPLRCRI
jgi:hypothetical protein